MIYDRLRVFVSSKMAELAPERGAIKDVLDELNVDAWVFEQDAGARPETIQESYREELDASDLYVGVFWKGYGDYTVDEFEHARKTGKDCLVYQKNGDRVADRDPRLQEFLDRIGSVEAGLTVQFFDSVEELREMVKRDAARWQTRIVRKYRESGPQRSSSGLPADPNLVVLRNRVRQFWIDGVLGRSIDAGLVDLSSERRPKAGDHGWEAILELPYEGSRVVEPGATVLDVFDELQSSLLVLGQPGSGKTTTALQLARDLIRRSERDASQPVPVVLNLSAWTPDSPSLLAWIAKEISGKYQIPGRISRPWLELGRLVLILDGLDEVAAERREACVEAIHRFCAEYGFAGLVVTCRLEEYDALPVRLRTNGAICLQPLGARQIDAFLDKSGSHLEGLRSALKTDATLRELARSPLMLSVMSMAYRDRSAAELREEEGSAEARRAHLFETYVDRAFEEKATGRSYSRETTTSWLSWLAKGMSRRNQTVFLIEDLQPNWLSRRAHLAAYLVALAILLGLVFGGLCILFRVYPSVLDNGSFGETGSIAWSEAFAWIACCAAWFLGICITDGLPWRAVRANARGPAVLRRVLTSVLVYGLLWVVLMSIFLENVQFEDPDYRTLVKNVPIAMTLGFAAFCARRSLSRSVRTTESLGLNWSRSVLGALWGVPIGLAFGAIISLLPGRELRGFVLWPMLTASFGAIVGGLEPRIVKGKTVPNQGMMLTLRTSLRAARWALLPTAIVLTAIVVLLLPRDELDVGPKLIAAWLTTAFVFFFVILAMWFGGLDLGKHLVLRGVIGFTRQAPYDFPRLLDDASRRNLMQRVGGGYLFAHRLLRDHFAAMDLPPPAREQARGEGGRWRRIPAAVAAMSALGAGGLALLTVGLQGGGRTMIVMGAIALGIGAQWVVVQTAITSALRAARREDEER